MGNRFKENDKKNRRNKSNRKAFPTSSTGQDLMMGSPASLTPVQLKELGIKVKED